MATRTADDWVRAALAMLARRGPEAVRVEPLAKHLKVTKGSFYWHFRDRGALRSAVLAEWERAATTAIIARIEGGGGSPGARLARLMALTATAPAVARAEQAIRAWGATERAVRRAVARVDGRREAYVRALLVACGVPAARAALRSRALYLMLLGEYATVANGGAATAAAVWAEQLALATRA